MHSNLIYDFMQKTAFAEMLKIFTLLKHDT